MTPENLKFIGTVATVVLLLFGGWLWAFKLVLQNTTRHIEHAIKGLVDANQRLEKRIDDEEKALLEFKAYVARHCVDRSDWVDFRTEFSMKLDRILAVR